MAFPSADPGAVALLLPDNSTQRDEFINGLVQGSTWEFGAGPHLITWSLNINEDYTTYPGPDPQPGPGGEWDDHPGMAEAVAKVLAAWADVANITFQQIVVPADQYYFESDADIAFTLTGDDLDRVFAPERVAGAAIFPDADYVDDPGNWNGAPIDRSIYPAPEGDVFLDNFEPHFGFLAPGGVGFTIILHETAHALGLKHPHDDGSSGRPSFGDLGIDDMDRMRHTVMSYDIVTPAPGPSGFAATPMPLDILAIQHLYGANMDHRTGNDVYKLRNASFRTIWDAGGTDTLSAADYAKPEGAVLDLREGAFSGRFGGARRMAIAYDAIIENAIGSSGGDQIIGNGAANLLQGSRGADRLTGGEGADKLFGGAGKDLLIGAAGDLRLHGGGGFDTLKLTGSLDLRLESGPAIQDVERISLEGGGTNGITLDAASLLDLSSTSDVLMVIGDAGDTVVLDGSIVDRGLSGGFHRYQLGSASLLVDTDIQVLQVQNA